MKTVLAIVFPIVFFSLVLASSWYLAYRLRVLFGSNRRWLLRISAVALFISSNIIMLSAAKSTNSVVGLLYVVSGYFYTFLIFLVMLLLLQHLVCLKWKNKLKLQGISVIICALIITSGGAFWASFFSVNRIEIQLEGLQNDVVIMHISDIHLGHHRGKEYLARIVEETNRLEPDLVLINGDLLDSNMALLPGRLSPLEDFESPVYFVGGNHEKYVNTKQALENISNHGVQILHNEIVNTHGIQLVGLDYMNPDEDTFDMHPSDDKRTIKGVLPTLTISSEKPAVLMHHSPVGANYMVTAGVDLFVAGHTHAGQVFPGTLFAQIIFPYNQGLYKEGKMKVFVSQGAGTFMPRVRLGTSNEIDLIRLKAKT